jgi:hypothetical protein
MRRLTFRPCSLALPLVASCLALIGCGSAIHVAHPHLQDQLTRVKRLALLPPDTRVFRQEFAGGQLVEDSSLVARHSVAEAVSARFGADGRFVMVPLEPDPAPSAREELEHVRRVFARHAELRITGAKGPPSCLPAAVSNLREAIDADAWLLVYAFGHISTSGFAAGQVGVGALVVAGTALSVLGGAPGGLPNLFAGPADAGPSVFAMCLVDARTGETLWFGARRAGFDLGDRGSVEAVVTELYGSLTGSRSR